MGSVMRGARGRRWARGISSALGSLSDGLGDGLAEVADDDREDRGARDREDRGDRDREHRGDRDRSAMTCMDRSGLSPNGYGPTGSGRWGGPA